MKHTKKPKLLRHISRHTFRRLLLAALIPAAAGASAAENGTFRGLELYTAFTGTVPYRAEKECTFVPVAGVRVQSVPVAAIVSVSQKEKLLLQEADRWLEKDPLDADRTVRLGLRLSGGSSTVPYRADLFAGTLRYGRALSRLKSPLPGSPSALSGASLPLPGIAPALPAFTSAQAALSAALCLTPARNGTPLPVIQCMCDTGGNSAVSLAEKLRFGNVQLTAALTGGAFVHGQRDSGKSWFLKEAFYREKAYGAADAEFTLSSKRCKGAVVLGAVENPAGALQDSFFWYRTEGSVQLGALRLKAAAFGAPQPDMLLPTGKKLMVRRQFQLSPQLTLKFPAGTVRTGIAVQQTERMVTRKGSAGPVPADEYKFQAALSFTHRRESVQAACGGSIAAKDGSKSGSARLSYSHNGTRFKSTSTAALSFSEHNRTFTLTERLTPKKTPFSSINMQAAVKYKDGEYESTKVSGGLSFDGTAHGINWSGKLSLSGSF